MTVARTLADDVVWRVPGETPMSGEYRGREDVLRFLRETRVQSDNTYRTELRYVVADDGHAVAVYRAWGERRGRTLDIEQALFCGVGAGWNEIEFRAFGVPSDHLVSRFEESFEIVRRLLGGERVTFHGAFHRVEDALLLPPPLKRPKLMIGANRPRMLAIALPHVDV